MKTTTILSSIILAFALSIPAAFSADKKKTPEPAAEPVKKDETKKELKKDEAKKDHRTLYAQLVSITATSLTVKAGEGKPDRKFVITKDTVIKKDDKAATVKDAVSSQWVGGYIKIVDGADNDEIVSLNLSAKQKEIKSAAKTETKATEEKKPAEPAPKKKAA